MSRRRKSTYSWSLDPADLAAVPNARTVRSLLRCIRQLPGSFPSHRYDDLGELLGPVLDEISPKVRMALKAFLKSPALPADARENIDFASPTLLRDHATQTMIGEGIARSHPAFKPLAEDIIARLQDYCERHHHPIDGNLDLLTELLALSPAESTMLRLAASTFLGTVDRNLFAFVPNGAQLCRAVEGLCGVRGRETHRLFHADGALAGSGLLNSFGGRRAAVDLEDLLVLSAMGDRLMSMPYETAADMAAAVLTPLPQAPEAECFDWPHLARQLALMAAALSTALERGSAGFNILLHGGPGTGKTAFARQVIAQIKCNGYAIDHRDSQGDEASRSDRLSNLRLSQCFAGHRQRTVLVLDEAEDVFQNDYQSPLARMFGHEPESKSWINTMLETNAHPVIWISNRVDYLDPAYLRRFSLCVEFPQTPLSLRKRLAQSTLAKVGCTPETIDAVSRNQHASPALLSAAARFADLTQGSGMGPDAAVLVHLDEHAKAQGIHAPGVLARRTQRFDMRYLNFAGNVTPDGLLQALQRDAGAAIVFSGPPGTGKTQFAAEIAQRMDRQLVVRTASDINSKWYGESEANVAGMFRQCDPKTEVLFLDEAEVLLAARESSGHRADRAVTAEFLRWLEVYEGTFICATNHAADFDAALMRRFAFRVHFLPMTLSQRTTMFAEQALGWSPEARQDQPALDDQTLQQLARLDLLTPGDFANAGRRARRLGLTAKQWVEELQAEQSAKGHSAQVRIGFI
ncbi:MAG: AAA family ATPase [Burkholderiales bacterium]|nr:AAA family ATPase [Burkholderiales bacterium]